ncbi:MAG: hypothetical protein ABI335_05990 [Polyangiaceae bacterium]
MLLAGHVAVRPVVLAPSALRAPGTLNAGRGVGARASKRYRVDIIVSVCELVRAGRGVARLEAATLISPYLSPAAGGAEGLLHAIREVRAEMV